MAGLRKAPPAQPRPERYTTAAEPGSAAQRAPERVKRAYVVVGPREVHGAHEGDTVELSLTEGEEMALIVAGHVVRANKNRPPAGRDQEGV